MTNGSRTRLFSVDRIEGRGAAARVILIADDDQTVELPRAVLGRLAVEGAVLRVPVHERGVLWSAAVRDRGQERRRIADAAKTLKRLSAADPGEDLEL